MKKIISILFVLAIVGSAVSCSSPFSPKELAGDYFCDYYVIDDYNKIVISTALGNNGTYLMEMTTFTDGVGRTQRLSGGEYKVYEKTKEISFEIGFRATIADDRKSFDIPEYGKFVKQ